MPIPPTSLALTARGWDSELRSDADVCAMHSNVSHNADDVTGLKLLLSTVKDARASAKKTHDAAVRQLLCRDTSPLLLSMAFLKNFFAVRRLTFSLFVSVCRVAGCRPLWEEPEPVGRGQPPGTCTYPPPA